MSDSSYKKLFIILGIVLVAAGAAYYVAGTDRTSRGPTTEETGSELEFPVSVTYACDGEKRIVAVYHEGPVMPEPEPGELPVPTGSVEVALDGAPSEKLDQTISASGIRYANADESFVFWSKGNEALVLRDNVMDLEYTNCIAE